MERDSYRRKTDNTLVDCLIAFIDEIFKGNSPTINILLPMINERIFYNDGKAIKIPLLTLFCASNEIPDEDEGLGALYDRLVIRMPINEVKDSANIIKMNEIFVAKRSGTFFNKNITTITIEELLAIQISCEKVKVPKAMLTTYIKLKSILNKQGINYSPRRINEGIKLMQANAIYESRNTVQLTDLEALKYVLWNNFEDIDTVEAEILKLSNPYDAEVKKQIENYMQIKNDIDSEKDPGRRKQKIMSGRNSINTVAKKINNVIKDAEKNGRNTDGIKLKLKEVTDYVTKIMEEVTGITGTDNFDPLKDKNDDDKFDNLF